MRLKRGSGDRERPDPGPGPEMRLASLRAVDAQDPKPKRVIDLRQCAPVKPEFAQLDNGQVQRCIHVPSPVRTFVLYVPDDVEHYRWLSAIEAARQQSRPSKSGWLVKQGERVKVRHSLRPPPRPEVRTD